MYNNYFYLLRAVSELNEIINNSHIEESFTQGKNLLFFHIPSDEFPNRHLVLCVSPQNPYLILRKNHRKAKKNTLQIFENYFPNKILDIGIAEDDRTIRINLKVGQIFFVIKGSKTNVFFYLTENEFTSFKKEKELFDFEITKKNYVNNLHFQKLLHDTKTYKKIDALKKEYPMLIKELQTELDFFTRDEKKKSLKESFNTIIQEILFDDIIVSTNTEMDKILFLPESFRTIRIIDEKQSFVNYNSALNYYFSINHKQKSIKNYRTELRNYFNKELTRLSSKLNKLKNRIDVGSKEDLYYSYGNNLLANIHKIEKGITEFLTKDLTTEKEITIQLDTKLTPQQNVDKFFDKAKDEKINYNKSKELHNLTKEKYDLLLEDSKMFNETGYTSDIEKLHEKYIQKKDTEIKMDSGLKFKYWQYSINEKYKVFIGRDSKSNDYLSVKFANQNDYWFHARGLPGSHVILRVENKKEVIPKDIIKKTASLAAYYSKAKTAGTAPVSYTFAKFVYKKKGMAPGKVLLTKEKTLLVKPEIPKNAELITE
ncbi:MAG: hypothetical protein CR986_05045 [Ignavibacteriae bacterium]|nr:MAG: hypothetical protein CR986_05045 [Ignavibacteriota bacterium]